MRQPAKRWWGRGSRRRAGGSASAARVLLVVVGIVVPLKPDTPKQAYWDACIGRYVAWLKLMVADDGTPMFPCVDPIDSDPPAIAHNLLRHGRSIGRIEVDDLTAPWAGREHPHGAGRRRARSARLRHLPPRRAAIRRGGRRRHHSTHRPPTCAAATGSCRCTPAAPGRGGFRALGDDERRDRGYGNGIGLVEQRLDGFVSADAAYTGGTLNTPSLRFSGERLELNMDVAAMGQARVEVRDESGRPLPGFELDRCRRVMVNDVRHAVSWDGSPSLVSDATSTDR